MYRELASSHILSPLLLASPRGALQKFSSNEIFVCLVDNTVNSQVLVTGLTFLFSNLKRLYDIFYIFILYSFYINTV